MRSVLFTGVVLFSIGIVGVGSTQAYERAGWTAELATYFHDVSGTVTILDQDTYRVDDFVYNGGGPAVYFYLGASLDYNDFLNGLATGPLLSGKAYDGSTSLVIDLPGGSTLDGFNAVSVWCQDFFIDFGSGLFMPPPPAPGDFNGDGAVEAEDLALLLGNWGKSAQPVDWTANWDGFVDANELAALLNGWGAGLGNSVPLNTVSVPEPATVLMVLAGVGLTRRRWHSI